jgi:hypothetical protein
MIFDASVAMTWLLFLALFPICFIWARRSMRIVLRRDFSEVALKHGIAPERPERFALYVTLVNLIGAGILAYVIVSVFAGWLSYDDWSGIAGATIWTKIILDFAISRHAHFNFPTDRFRIRSREA